MQVQRPFLVDMTYPTMSNITQRNDFVKRNRATAWLYREYWKVWQNNFLGSVGPFPTLSFKLWETKGSVRILRFTGTSIFHLSLSPNPSCFQFYDFGELVERSMTPKPMIPDFTQHNSRNIQKHFGQYLF